MKNWTDNEIEFLIENYPKYGCEYCADFLNKTNKSITNKVRRLKIYVDKENIYKTEKFKDIVKKSYSYSDVCRYLNLTINSGNIKTITNYINLYVLDISHFKFVYENINKYKKQKIEDILVENSTYSSSSHLKDRLYKEGLKTRKCEKCGQDENWNGEHMSLILDHINGKNNDNRLENLQIVCPNCNATLETTCRGFSKLERMKKKFFNNKTDKFKKNLIKYYCECGVEINKESKYCQKCYNIKRRKIINRPSLKQLELDIKEFGYSYTGRKYNVSDTCIRKWIKQYEK